MRKKIAWTIVVLLVVILLVTLGGSFYMLNFSLASEDNRADTASSLQRQYDIYPETRPWVDSLKQYDALRDTFVLMPSGEKHHAYYVSTGSNKTALIIHGWRNTAIDFFFLARMYEREMGYNVVMPDLYAHGLSEGDMIQMGWKDRDDALYWLNIFKTDTMVVHGVSMGAATTMMMSSQTLPDGIKDIHFIEDCGYTSVWDEFSYEMKELFNLPDFPLMYTASILCKLCYGWHFDEASALEEVKKCPHPMLFIHGDNDTFVPTKMVYELYDAKPSKKKLWITKNTRHAESYSKYRAEYLKTVRRFLGEL